MDSPGCPTQLLNEGHDGGSSLALAGADVDLIVELVERARRWLRIAPSLGNGKRAADTSDYDRDVSLPSEPPAQAELRAAAMALENARIIGAVLDHKWRTVFLSSESVAVFQPEDLSGFLNTSQIVQALDDRIPISVPLESQVR